MNVFLLSKINISTKVLQTFLHKVAVNKVCRVITNNTTVLINVMNLSYDFNKTENYPYNS